MIASPLSTNRYDFLASLGSGCWGIVYKAHDTFLREDVAVKVFNPRQIASEQMVERKLDEFKAMAKEAGELKPAKHVVPRRFEVDADNKPYIVMPVYEQFLSDALQEDGERISRKNRLSLDQIVAWAGHLAEGIREMHTYYGRGHGDIKPDNIAIDPVDGLKYTDLGTSTVLIGGSDDPRSNMGFPGTRAPENMRDGDHPTEQHDIFSYGALLYRLFTGKYPAEQMEDFYQTYNQSTPFTWKESLDALVKDKSIPKPFKKLIKNSLSKPVDRWKDADDLKQGYEKAKRKTGRRTWQGRLRRWGLAAAVIGVLGGTAVTTYDKMQETEQELAESEANARYDRMWSAVRKYCESSRPTNLGWSELNHINELKEWEYFLGDRNSAIAAFMDPDGFYKASQLNGGTFVYDSLKETLYDINMRLALDIRHGINDPKDTWQFNNWGEGWRPHVMERWNRAKETYETEQREDSLRRADTSTTIMPIIGTIKSYIDSSGNRQHTISAGYP